MCWIGNGWIYNNNNMWMGHTLQYDLEIKNFVIFLDLKKGRKQTKQKNWYYWNIFGFFNLCDNGLKCNNFWFDLLVLGATCTDYPSIINHFSLFCIYELVIHLMYDFVIDQLVHNDLERFGHLETIGIIVMLYKLIILMLFSNDISFYSFRFFL